MASSSVAERQLTIDAACWLWHQGLYRSALEAKRLAYLRHLVTTLRIGEFYAVVPLDDWAEA
jgi:hypothetical protein